MRLLLISSSNVHGYGFLEQPAPEIRSFLNGLHRVAFVPFALPDHLGYTERVRERLGQMGLEVLQVGDVRDLDAAEAVFVGGGNTFRLLRTLHQRSLMEPIRELVRAGMPYLGSSAGTNVAAPTIKTTNDMPIVEVPSLDAFGFVPFQINPHYVDSSSDSTHMGETREERILDYLEENDIPVIGLREGSALRAEQGSVRLVGDRTARLFRRGRPPSELAPGAVRL
jgi:dipeptidase E